MSQIERIRACQKIIITGSVAVGKTTAMNALCDKLDKCHVNWIKVPEYIDMMEDGLDMLNKYLSRKISSFKFQKYVIDYYNKFLMNLNVNGDEVLIFERSVDDAISCFSKIEFDQGRLSLSEYNSLYEMAYNINTNYNLPSYFLLDNGFDFTCLKTDDDVSGIVLSRMLCNDRKNIIVGLYNSDKECLERVNDRRRPGENSYNINSIHNFNKCYGEIFISLIRRQRVSFALLKNKK